MNEIWAAVVGAIVGAVLAGSGSFLQQRWSRGRAHQDRIEDDRKRLVREIMRYRLDQDKLVLPLNELPLMFGDDDETMRLVRALLVALPEQRTQFLADLINHLAKQVGLPPKVTTSDITRGFRT
ncbi:hypothetical protein [Kocuria marina]|jgi:hypothetical protein|uniref:hypothetical protein n=1 Tax=Kocuria TaxID=57493 RepID=UPI0011A751D1|nr:hypothetical protein [Kocuria indica]MBX7556388.1 hypothetical protein [Streptomyces sp. tea 10]